jgi:hypothetical protein
LTSSFSNVDIQAIEITSALCKEFPTQPLAEQRRLLHTIIERATWQNGEPYEQLRLSNRANTT